MFCDVSSGYEAGIPWKLETILQFSSKETTEISEKLNTSFEKHGSDLRQKTKKLRAIACKSRENERRIFFIQVLKSLYVTLQQIHCLRKFRGPPKEFVTRSNTTCF